MISIYMNDLQHVITNVWAGRAAVCQESVCNSFIFYYIIVFFHHSKIIIMYFSSVQINHLYDF